MLNIPLLNGKYYIVVATRSMPTATPPSSGICTTPELAAAMHATKREKEEEGLGALLGSNRTGEKIR